MRKHKLLIMTFVLAFIGGFIDTYSFYLHGGKYAFLQTGTMISSIYSLFFNNVNDFCLGAIVFISLYLGVVITYLINYYLKKKNHEKYFNAILLSLDIFLLMPSLFFTKANSLDISLFAVISLGIAGGTMLEAFRELVVSFSSTMMTNNTRLLVDSLMDGITKKNKSYLKKSIIFLLIICSFVLGVSMFICFFKYNSKPELSILLPMGLFVFLLALEIMDLVFKKEIDLNKYCQTFIPDKYLNTYEQLLINHLYYIDVVEIKKLNISNELYLSILKLKSMDEDIILGDVKVSLIYKIWLLENNKIEELKKILQMK